jgi:hypothetical protein
MILALQNYENVMRKIDYKYKCLYIINKIVTKRVSDNTHSFVPLLPYVLDYELNIFCFILSYPQAKIHCGYSL